MDCIRVLHVVGKMHRGGIETLLMEIYRRIDRTRVQFDFLLFTHDPGDYDEEIKNMGGRLFYVTPRRKNPLKHYVELFKVLKRHPDICKIQLHMSSCSYIEPLLIAKIAGIKDRIAHSHNTSCSGRIKKVIHQINQRILNLFATKYFACSNAAGEWMFGPRAWKNGFVVFNGIETRKFSFSLSKRESIRIKMGIEDSFVLGYVGRFEYQKNPLFVCEIFCELKKIHKNMKLLLVGEGSLHKAMDDIFIKYGVLDDVIYTGVVCNSQDYYQVMDCFVLPSFFEGLGIVAVEAQSAGLPTLLSNKVPEEAFVTDLAHALPIDKGINCWCEKIEGVIKAETTRNDMSGFIARKKYDISSTAKFLEKAYLDIG